MALATSMMPSRGDMAAASTATAPTSTPTACSAARANPIGGDNPTSDMDVHMALLAHSVLELLWLATRASRTDCGDDKDGTAGTRAQHAPCVAAGKPSFMQLYDIVYRRCDGGRAPRDVVEHSQRLASVSDAVTWAVRRFVAAEPPLLSQAALVSKMEQIASVLVYYDRVVACLRMPVSQRERAAMARPLPVAQLLEPLGALLRREKQEAVARTDGDTARHGGATAAQPISLAGTHAPSPRPCSLLGP